MRNYGAESGHGIRLCAGAARRQSESVDAQVRQLTKAGCKKVFREVASGERPTARSCAGCSTSSKRATC